MASILLLFTSLTSSKFYINNWKRRTVQNFWIEVKEGKNDLGPIKYTVYEKDNVCYHSSTELPATV